MRRSKKFTMVELMIVSAIIGLVVVMTSMFWQRITGMFITQKDAIDAVDSARNSLLQISLDLKQASYVIEPAVEETTDKLVLIKQIYEFDKDPKTATDFDGNVKENSPVYFTEAKITYELEDYTTPHNPFGLLQLVRTVEYPKGTIKKQKLRKYVDSILFIRQSQSGAEFIEPNHTDNGFPAPSIQTIINIVKYNAIKVKSVDADDPDLAQKEADMRKYILTQSIMTRMRGIRL